jgi:SAM-dependent methyltransferase
VYSIESLCHVPDKPGAYREIARVLKAGGVFVGHDWLRADNLGDEATKRLIEPICQWHAMPALSTLGEVRAGLDRVGLTVDEVCDAAAHGDLTPNWTLIEKAAAAVAGSDSAVIRLMARGGLALCAAARSGAFLVGYWLARKPVV